VFLRVTVWTGLWVPTFSVPKSRCRVERVEMEVPGTKPVPKRATVWGLSLASSVIAILPVRLPAALGLKVTPKEQVLAPGAGGKMKGKGPQVLAVIPKSPLGIMLEMVRLTVPVLVTVIVWEGLVVPTCWGGNARLPAERLTSGVPGATPVPERAIVWGLSEASSVIVMLPATRPGTVGRNPALIVQNPPTGKALGQLFVWENSAPVARMLVTGTCRSRAGHRNISN